MFSPDVDNHSSLSLSLLVLFFYMGAFVQFADALKYVVHLIGSEWGYFEEAYKRSFEAKTFQLSPFSHSLNEYHSSCSKILASLHEFSV